jgi:prepilin-type N-terminal cleavage/methylation domain-containing protein
MELRAAVCSREDDSVSEVPERLRVRRLRFEEAAAGFTLIELLVVMLIIGILLAIVTPRFLSTSKTAIRAEPANLLYTSGNHSHFGVCGGTGVSPITAVDTGLTSVSGKGSTKANTASINPGGAAGRQVPVILSPSTTDCSITVDQQASQPAGANVAGTTNLSTGTCHGVIRHAIAARCVAESTPAGKSYSTSQST